MRKKTVFLLGQFWVGRVIRNGLFLSKSTFSYCKLDLTTGYYPNFTQKPSGNSRNVIWHICLWLFWAHFRPNFVYFCKFLDGFESKITILRLVYLYMRPFFLWRGPFIVVLWLIYSVCRIALTFLIWLKMTFKCIVQMKARRFYNHIDPHFDMEHQLMSADPYPVTKLTWCKQSIFHSFSNYF